MIRVYREGKPLCTFPDRALAWRLAGEILLKPVNVI